MQTHEGRDGVSRQGKDRGAGASDSEPERFPGALGDFMENGAYSKLVQGFRDEIEFAHGDAPAQDENVVRLEVELESALQVRQVIDDMVVCYTLKAVRSQRRNDTVCV